MSTINKVEFELILKDYLSKHLEQAEAKATKLEHKLDDINKKGNETFEAFKKIGEIAAVAFAVEKIGEFVKESREAYEQIEFAQSQLKAGLASTQGQAGVSFNDMVASAQKFSHELKFTKAQVEGVQGVLLTFPAVSKDIFDRTTQAALDMATRMKGDPQTSILQLGKALQDPIKGLAALGKAGVNVNELKKKFETVTDTAQRQKLILKELEGEFAGSAKAAAEADVGFRRAKTIEEMKNSVGELADKVEEALAPALEWFANVGMQAVNKLTEFWNFIEENVDFKGIADAIRGFGAGVYNFFQPLFEPIKNLFMTVWNGIKKIWDALSQFAGDGTGLLSGLQVVLGGIIEYFTWLYDKITSFIAAIIDFAHTVYVLLDKLGAIWLLGKAFEFVWGIIKGIGGMLSGIYEHTIKPILDGVGWAYEKLKGLLGIKDVKVSGKVEGGGAKEKSILEQGADASKGGAMPKIATEGGISGGSKDASKVTGSKSTTINITIGKLIEEFKVQTNNIGEGAGKVKELVAQTLLGAVNDSQVVAGI